MGHFLDIAVGIVVAFIGLVWMLVTLAAESKSSAAPGAVLFVGGLVICKLADIYMALDTVIKHQRRAAEKADPQAKDEKADATRTARAGQAVGKRIAYVLGRAKQPAEKP